MQLAFCLQFETVPASQYSAFAQNVVMSLLFIASFFKRDGLEGQTLTIAVVKCVGTLAPTFLGGVIESFNIYILLMRGLASSLTLPISGLLPRQGVTQRYRGVGAKRSAHVGRQ